MIKRSLAGHEEIIAAGVKSFIDVGNSLMAIRDEKLYAKEHDTFEEYCSKRWGFAKSRAYQYIESAVVVRDLSTIVDTKTDVFPENEAQARAIAGAAPDAKTRAVVWKAAVRSAPKDDKGKPHVTASLVNKAAVALGHAKPPRSVSAAVDIAIGREPGEDDAEPEHKAPKAFDEKEIDAAYGTLVRLLDKRGDAFRCKNGPRHKECLKHLDEFMVVLKEWRAVRK